jgi:sugar lactone lactonase YvrE
LGGNTSTDNGVPVAGNCTVVRIDLALSATAAPQVTTTTVVGKNFPWQANKAALDLAPTGLALGHDGTLYVADTETNKISAIAEAATRTTAVSASSSTISSGGALNAPLGMMLAPNGDLIVVNGNDGNAVEVTPTGAQVATKTLVANGAGDLFGLTATAAGDGILLVNDGTNALDLYHA